MRELKTDEYFKALYPDELVARFRAGERNFEGVNLTRGAGINRRTERGSIRFLVCASCSEFGRDRSRARLPFVGRSFRGSHPTALRASHALPGKSQRRVQRVK